MGKLDFTADEATLLRAYKISSLAPRYAAWRGDRTPLTLQSESGKKWIMTLKTHWPATWPVPAWEEQARVKLRIRWDLDGILSAFSIGSINILYSCRLVQRAWIWSPVRYQLASAARHLMPSSVNRSVHSHLVQIFRPESISGYGPPQRNLSRSSCRHSKSPSLA